MQDYSRLKLKYPLYFAGQWVLRDPGTDVKKKMLKLKYYLLKPTFLPRLPLFYFLLYLFSPTSYFSFNSALVSTHISAYISLRVSLHVLLDSNADT